MEMQLYLLFIAFKFIVYSKRNEIIAVGWELCKPDVLHFLVHVKKMIFQQWNILQKKWILKLKTIGKSIFLIKSLKTVECYQVLKILLYYVENLLKMSKV